MNVYIGSKNRVKVEAVQDVLKNYNYNFIALAVNSCVSDQPKSDKETITGALNRAKALPEDGLRFGLEAGVELLDDKLFLTNFGVLIDEIGTIYYAGGTRIVLPEIIKEYIFEKGYELADAMDEYFKTIDIKKNNGAIGFFTAGLVNRKDIFIHIIKLLYGQYLYRRGIK